jgi:hypothetical protein
MCFAECEICERQMNLEIEPHWWEPGQHYLKLYCLQCFETVYPGRLYKILAEASIKARCEMDDLITDDDTDDD